MIKKDFKEKINANRNIISSNTIDYTDGNKNIIISTGRKFNRYLEAELKAYIESIISYIDNYNIGEKIALSDVCDCFYDLVVMKKIRQNDIDYIRLEIA